MAAPTLAELGASSINTGIGLNAFSACWKGWTFMQRVTEGVEASRMPGLCSRMVQNSRMVHNSVHNYELWNIVEKMGSVFGGRFFHNVPQFVQNGPQLVQNVQDCIVALGTFFPNGALSPAILSWDCCMTLCGDNVARGIRFSNHLSPASNLRRKLHVLCVSA